MPAAVFPKVDIALPGIALAFGFAVLAMAYAIGHISSCHLNPAVSIGLTAVAPSTSRTLRAPTRRAAASGNGSGGLSAVNVEVAQLIDQLENLVAMGRRVPLSAHTVIVDEQSMLDIIDQLRVAVPEEVKQARRLTQERDRVLSHDQAEADKIIRAAQAKAERMVSESEVASIAQERAEATVAAAEARAQELRREADNYVLEALTGLDEELSRLLAQIRRGTLAGRRHLAGTQATPALTS